MARTSRRALLSAGATAALASIAVAASALPAAVAETVPDTHPDAALIALCHRFIDLEQQKLASYEREPPHLTVEEENALEEAERIPIMNEQLTIYAAMVEVRATTLDGLRARARALVIYDQYGWENEELSHGGMPGGMNFAIVRDLIGESI